MQKNRFYTREFLNKEGFHSIGYILAEVEHTTSFRRSEPSITLMIGDCNRYISLDFEVYSELDRENTLYKLDLLCDTLLKFRAAVKEEIEVQVKRENRRDRKKKKKSSPTATHKDTVKEQLENLLRLEEDIST